MKKEVSDHIARAFLETKSEKKKDSGIFFYVLLSLLVVVGLVFASSLGTRDRGRPAQGLDQALIFEKHDGPYVLDFNFENSSAKTESLAIEIPDVDLSAYQRVNFSLRLANADARKLGSVKVGLVNRRKETSSLYLSEINQSWKKLSLRLSDFSNVRDWTRPSQIVFTLEAWNIFPAKGELLIDGIEFSKN